MTRKRFLFTNHDGCQYITAEYNGDKYEFEDIGSADSCDRSWCEIESAFRRCRTLDEFRETDRKMQAAYHSSIGEREYEPVRRVSEFAECDEVVPVFADGGYLTVNDINFARFLIEERMTALDDDINVYSLWGHDVNDEKTLLDALKSKLEALHTTPIPGWHIQADEANHYSYTRIIDDALDTVEVVRVTHGKHKGDPAEYLHTIVCLSEYHMDYDLNKVLADFGADPLLDPTKHYDSLSDVCDKLNAAYKARREEIANLIGETMAGRKMPPAMADSLARKLTNT